MTIFLKKINCFIELNGCFGITEKRAYYDRNHKFQIIFDKRKDLYHFVFIIYSRNIDKLNQATYNVEMLSCDTLIDKYINFFDFFIFLAWIVFVLIFLIILNFFSKLLYWIERVHFCFAVKMDLLKYNRFLYINTFEKIPEVRCFFFDSRQKAGLHICKLSQKCAFTCLCWSKSDNKVILIKEFSGILDKFN